MSIMGNGSETLIRVTFERYQHGYVATSKSLKGLFIAHKSFDTVAAAVPTAIKLLFKAQDGIDVVVSQISEASDTQSLNDVPYLAKAA